MGIRVPSFRSAKLAPIPTPLQIDGGPAINARHFHMCPGCAASYSDHTATLLITWRSCGDRVEIAWRLVSNSAALLTIEGGRGKRISEWLFRMAGYSPNGVAFRRQGGVEGPVTRHHSPHAVTYVTLTPRWTA